jgi:hypothetical protein
VTRRRKLISAGVIVTLVSLVAGVSYAAFNGRLKGSASVSALAFTLDPTVVASNDSNNLDPTGPGDAPTRATYDVAKTTATITGNVVNVVMTGAYPGARATVSTTGHVIGGGSAAFRVQGVSVVGALPAGVTLVTGIDPIQCGATLANTATTWTYLSVDLKLVDVPDGASFSFSYQIDMVPAAAYVAASCNAFAA